jgi:hypothetical protein
MQNSEYIPDHNEAASDTAPRVPPLKLTPTGKDPRSPFDLREEVSFCQDGDHPLTPFAKLLFCRLTDMAFKKEFKRGDGVLECSKKFLAEVFNVTADTMTRAARALEGAGFIWTRTIYNGAFEMTWWFIREWADPKKEFAYMNGKNFGRARRGIQRNTLRGERGKFAPNPTSMRSQIRALLAAHGLAEPTVKAKISPVQGEESARPALRNQPGAGGILSPATVEKSALPRLINQPGAGVEISPARAEESARPRRKNQPGHGAEMSGLTTLKDDKREGEGDFFKRSTVLNAQSAGRGPKAPSRENTFLLDVAACMDRWQKGAGKKEMLNSGAWWRLAYQANARLAEKVLADTLCQVKEGAIKKHPGAHAVDLWKRWGGGKVAR